jgi:hypothetical protein
VTRKRRKSVRSPRAETVAKTYLIQTGLLASGELFLLLGLSAYEAERARERVLWAEYGRH